jgi:hypothetical protein
MTFLDGSLRLGSGDSNLTASVAPVVVQRVENLFRFVRDSPEMCHNFRGTRLIAD